MRRLICILNDYLHTIWRKSLKNLWKASVSAKTPNPIIVPKVKMERNLYSGKKNWDRLDYFLISFLMPSCLYYQTITKNVLLCFTCMEIPDTCLRKWQPLVLHAGFFNIDYASTLEVGHSNGIMSHSRHCFVWDDLWTWVTPEKILLGDRARLKKPGMQCESIILLTKLSI